MTRGWRCRWSPPRPGSSRGVPARPAPWSGLLAFAAAAASLPIAWLAWGAAAGGDPLFFAHYISADHAELAATVAARYGALLGRRAPARDLGAGVRGGDDTRRCRPGGRRLAPPRRARSRPATPSRWWPRWVRRRSTWPAGWPPRASSRWRASRLVPGALLLPFAADRAPRDPLDRRPRADGGGRAGLLGRHLAGRHPGTPAHLGGCRIDGRADPPRRRGSGAGRPPAGHPPGRRAGS